MKNKGFSLVELIVVIAIMAILVGVAVPIYTSYIDKANAAKDEQLLGEINSAFAVALAGNAIDVNTVTEADIPVENGAVNLSGMTVNGAENATIENAMIEILGTDLEFAVIEEIFYNSVSHKFEENVTLEVSYGGGVIKLDAKDIAALKNSNFYTAEGLGVGGLLNKVDFVTAFAMELLEDGGSAFENVLDDPEYQRFLATTLGIEGAETMEDAQLLTAIAAKEQELNAKYGEGAAANLFVNGAVLYSAKKIEGQQDSVLDLLSGENPKAAIVETMGTDTGVALSQASVAYGLYTSYAYSTGDQTLIANTSDPVKILNGLEDEGFQEYLKTEQAKKDLEGYMSAMNMINGSSGDTDAATELLVNGFGNSTLVNGMEDAIG